MINIRSYNPNRDHERVGTFLIETYQPGDVFLNWLQPRWEYMHYHSNIDEVDLGTIGLFEEAGEILGVVNIEHAAHQVYFHVRPGIEHVKPLMFDYAQAKFEGISASTGRLIRALFINEHDATLTDLAASHGYERWDDFREDMSRYSLEAPLPEPVLPVGFHLLSLQDEFDLHKINRVLWRGFNHPGPPPEEEIEGRRRMKDAPNFREDLTIVVVAPDGNYVSYCGMWVVPENQIAYVEPVATDPDYRRMGLGRAAVLESMRRAASVGAQVAWVGSGLDFYKAIGFETTFTIYPWVKYLD
jgi:predicted N-acetyltransferase YhbS